MRTHLNTNNIVLVVELLAVCYEIAQLVAHFCLLFGVAGDICRLRLDLSLEILDFVLQLLDDDLGRNTKVSKFQSSAMLSYLFVSEHCLVIR